MPWGTSPTLLHHRRVADVVRPLPQGDFVAITKSLQAVQFADRVIVFYLHSRGFHVLSQGTVSWRCSLYGLSLHLRIGMGVYERGLQLGMAKPLGQQLKPHSALVEMHGP